MNQWYADHLEILSSDVSTWNQWREDHPEVTPDLTAADLSGHDLRGANFREALLGPRYVPESELVPDTVLVEVVRYEPYVGDREFRIKYSGPGRLSERAEERIFDKVEDLIRRRRSEGGEDYEMDVDSDDLDLADYVLAEDLGEDAYLLPARFRGSNLSGADFSGAHLRYAVFDGADMSEACLAAADLRNATGRNAKLVQADFSRALLSACDFTGADFTRSSLYATRIINSDFRHAKLDHCQVYGASVWDVQLEGASQSEIVITPSDAASITVDSLAIAQFIHCLLDNSHLRGMLDAVANKMVLILGRFSQRRKAVLDAVRDELRKHDLVPVLFDFMKPNRRNLLETVSTLAHLSRCVIVDLTDARSVLQELTAIVPHLPSVPVLPIRAHGSKAFGMIESLRAYPWFGECLEYRDRKALLRELLPRVLRAK